MRVPASILLLCTATGVIAAPAAGAAPVSPGDVVVYEVFSDGPLEQVQWQDANGVTQVATPLEKTWSLQITNQAPFNPVGPNYLVMASTYGKSVACRLTVNGVVVEKDSQVVPDAMHAVVCCQPLPGGGCVHVD